MVAVCRRGSRILVMAVMVVAVFPFVADLASPDASESEFVVVVNEENDVSELSLFELRRIYRGERKHWKGGDPIRVLLPRRGSAAMQSVVENVFEMRGVVEIAQYYMAAIYQEKIAQPPPTVSAAEAISIVARSKNALAVVARSQAAGKRGIKLIPVDGI